jgi:hypothetical protein
LAGPDAIRLVNVRYHVNVLDPMVTQLVVPAANPDAKGITYKTLFDRPSGTQFIDLPPNMEVAEMYLFAPASGALNRECGQNGLAIWT